MTDSAVVPTVSSMRTRPRKQFTLSDRALEILEELPEGERSKYVSELLEDSAQPGKLEALLRAALRVVRRQIHRVG